jgi:aminopeptidase N
MASHRVVLSNQLVPSHYALHLTPDLDACVFSCDQEIHVSVREETDQVTLHAREITIDSVSFQASDANLTVPVLIETRYNSKYHTVCFIFDGKLPVGDGKLLIKYKGILNGDMAGFYKSTYSDANGNKKIMASTQFEALDARR